MHFSFLLCVLHGLQFHPQFQNQMEPKQKCEVRGSSGGLYGAYGMWRHVCWGMCVTFLARCQTLHASSIWICTTDLRT